MRVKPYLFAIGSILLGACPDDEEPSPGEIEITVNLAPADALPGGAIEASLVAFQEGDGPWQVMPGQNGVHKAVITSRRYGVAVGCRPFVTPIVERTNNFLTIAYSTIEEATTLLMKGCYLPPAQATVTGTVTGAAQDEVVYLQTGEFVNEKVEGGAFGLLGPKRKQPLFAVITPVGAQPTAPTRVLRLADIDFTSSSPLAVNVSAAVAPVTFPLTLPAGVSNAGVTAVVRRGEDNFGARIRGTTTQYSTVPASQLREGDAIRLAVSVSDSDTQLRSSFLYLGQPGPATVELPPMLSSRAPTIPRAGKRLLRVELPEATGTLPLVELRISASTSDDSTSTGHFVSMSKGWRGQGAMTYVIPDLSGVPGYLASMALPPALDVSWSISLLDSTDDGFVPGHKALMATNSGNLAN